MAWFCHGKVTPMKRQELMRDPARKELVNAMKVLMKHHIVENITVSQICQQQICHGRRSTVFFR